MIMRQQDGSQPVTDWQPDSTNRSLYRQEAHTDWTLGSSVPSGRLQKVPSLICSQMSLVCPSCTFLTG